MYVDESGDTGPKGTPYFILSGMVVHESDWRTFATQMLTFRRTMKVAHGLPIRAEIHAADYIRKPPVPGMLPHVRIAILRNFLDEIAKQPYVSITNVVVRKATKPATYDVFDNAWRALFQRFENTLKFGHFPGQHRNDFGLVFTDATDGKKLTKLVRRMSVYNPIPNQLWAGPGHRNLPVLRVIEDPHPKDSAASYFIQAVDVSAYFLTQRYAANGTIRRHNASRYFDRLLPVLNTRASRFNSFGIVEL